MHGEFAFLHHDHELDPILVTHCDVTGIQVIWNNAVLSVRGQSAKLQYIYTIGQLQVLSLLMQR